jgi:hypothetical protein
MRWLKKFDTTGPWVPAFPTDQVRGLKAHGKDKWDVFRIRTVDPDLSHAASLG